MVMLTDVKKRCIIKLVARAGTIAGRSCVCKHRAQSIWLSWIRGANGNVETSSAVHLNTCTNTVIACQQKVDRLCFGNYMSIQEIIGYTHARTVTSCIPSMPIVLLIVYVYSINTYRWISMYLRAVGTLQLVHVHHLKQNQLGAPICIILLSRLRFVSVHLQWHWQQYYLADTEDGTVFWCCSYFWRISSRKGLYWHFHIQGAGDQVELLLNQYFDHNTICPLEWCGIFFCVCVSALIGNLNACVTVF